MIPTTSTVSVHRHTTTVTPMGWEQTPGGERYGKHGECRCELGAQRACTSCPFVLSAKVH